MLKVKDNVDLKELEKFKFKLIQNKWGSDYYSNKLLLIFVEDRQVRIGVTDSLNQLAEDSLFDLIKADLLEKI